MDWFQIILWKDLLILAKWFIETSQIIVVEAISVFVNLTYVHPLYIIEQLPEKKKVTNYETIPVDGRINTRILNMAGTKSKLNTGAEIPLIGFGTWQDVGSQEDAVKEAIKAGYRHIDTARVYVENSEK